jgi:hypothetical protein
VILVADVSRMIADVVQHISVVVPPHTVPTTKPRHPGGPSVLPGVLPRTGPGFPPLWMVALALLLIGVGCLVVAASDRARERERA